MKLNIIIAWVCIITASPVFANNLQGYSKISNLRDFTIAAKISDAPTTPKKTNGYFDFLLLEDGRLKLENGLIDLVVIDKNDELVSWPNARPILAQALYYSELNYDVLPGSEYEYVETDTNNFFSVPEAFITLSRAQALIKGRWFDDIVWELDARAFIYRDAFLRAIALSEAKRFDNSLDSAMRAAKKGSLLALGFASSVTSSGSGVVEELRHITSSKASIKYTGSDAGVASKVTKRVGRTKLAKASKSLGVLAYGVELVSAFSDHNKQNKFLAEVARDADLIHSLTELSVFFELAGDADPAVVQGLDLAIEEIVKLSKSRLHQISNAGGKAFSDSAPTLASMAAGAIASGGAAVVIKEILELEREFNKAEGEVLIISALASVGRYIQSRTDALTMGESVGAATDKLVSIIELYKISNRISAEATASTHSLIWGKRWDNMFSVAGMSKGLGLTIAEIKAKYTNSGVDEVDYSKEVQKRIDNVSLDLSLSSEADKFISELKPYYAAGRIDNALGNAMVSVRLKGPSALTDRVSLWPNDTKVETCDRQSVEVQKNTIFIGSGDRRRQISLNYYRNVFVGCLEEQDTKAFVIESSGKWFWPKVASMYELNTGVLIGRKICDFNGCRVIGKINGIYEFKVVGGEL